ncbi:MAG TPA: hypothetical protein VJ124_18765 [Pyrinomonadaceae bacterium]|nr:hypothetical protein [Pyrinomonadaceae bacterium]
MKSLPAGYIPIVADLGEWRPFPNYNQGKQIATRDYSTPSKPPGLSPPPLDSPSGSNSSGLDAGETSVAAHGFGAGAVAFLLLPALERAFPPFLAGALFAAARFVPLFAGLRGPFLAVLRAAFLAAFREERLLDDFLAGLFFAPFPAPLDFLRPFLATMLLSPSRIRLACATPYQKSAQHVHGFATRKCSGPSHCGNRLPYLLKDLASRQSTQEIDDVAKKRLVFVTG